MIKISGLNKAFTTKVLFDDLNLSINRGEKVGLVGRNGHGKSTLFQMILGNVEADSGTISTPKGYKIGHLQQHLHFTKPTVLEECSLGLPEGEEYETWKVEKNPFRSGFFRTGHGKKSKRFFGGLSDSDESCKTSSLLSRHADVRRTE